MGRERRVDPVGHGLELREQRAHASGASGTAAIPPSSAASSSLRPARRPRWTVEHLGHEPLGERIAAPHVGDERLDDLGAGHRVEAEHRAAARPAPRAPRPRQTLIRPEVGRDLTDRGASAVAATGT